MVIPEPFSQDVFNNELKKVLSGNELEIMAKNALDYAEKNEDELFSRPQKAADVIELAIAIKKKQLL